ncbi:MAG: flagellar hook assembly protein FlgD [Holosporales bacterium]|jgi:flagellar basal-body rod modification protein FlgD
MTSTITSSTAATTAAPQTAAEKSKALFGSNFDTFLKLLTNQLSNQDPLDPVDTAKFTEQLVQFAGVEQNIATNTNLEKLIGLNNAGQNSAALGYIGKNVQATTNQIFSNGSSGSTIGYTNTSDFNTVSIDIINANGRIIRTLSAPATKGQQSISWDGKDSLNVQAPAGTYTVKASGYDTAKKATALTTTTTGIVSAIETSNGTSLTVNDISVPVTSIIAVKTANPS